MVTTLRQKTERVCVIGAGSSGLAALREFTLRGIPVGCLEAGSRVGGNWRYENDNGRSAAYASLRTNVSRPRMQYPSFPMPADYGDFPGHEQMAAYLDAYAGAFDLERHIRFRATVASAAPEAGGSWEVGLADGSRRAYRALVVANGHDWRPNLPELPGDAEVEVSHAREYRTPEPFAGQRVLVIGAGQSGAEIACEVSRVAARTWLSARGGAHVLPRYVAGAPYDRADRVPFNSLPWPLLRALFASLAAHTREARPADLGLSEPAHRFLEQLPIVSDELVPALRGGAVEPLPGVERLEGRVAHLAGGAAVEVDRVVCATGYRVEFPFLPDGLVDLDRRGKAARLYRRIAAPRAPGLFFVGLADAPGGLLPLVEAQAAWLADLLEGCIRLPSRARMEAAIDRGERRSRQRFPAEPPDSIRLDPHAHRRMLARDRLRARVSGVLRRAEASLEIPR